MSLEREIRFEFTDSHLGYEKIEEITKLFVINGISLQFFEDTVNNNINLFLSYKRYQYTMIFYEDNDNSRYIIPNGCLRILHEHLAELMYKFIEIIKANVKVFEKLEDSVKLLKEFKRGELLYDVNVKSSGYNESALHMLIDYSLAELSEAIDLGDDGKIKEIEALLRSYQKELSKY